MVHTKLSLLVWGLFTHGEKFTALQPRTWVKHALLQSLTLAYSVSYFGEGPLQATVNGEQSVKLTLGKVDHPADHLSYPLLSLSQLSLGCDTSRTFIQFPGESKTLSEERGGTVL